MSTDTIERVAWQAYADACLEHDGRHAQRAAAEVKLLLPRQASRTREGGRTLRA
ncbi:MAG: hypothetical protein JWM62_198 [Frankiales bacterium]|jgi:hypothetical protein|nr:hypothetical protein [Frankiales bacterium]